MVARLAAAYSVRAREPYWPGQGREMRIPRRVGYGNAVMHAGPCIPPINAGEPPEVSALSGHAHHRYIRATKRIGSRWNAQGALGYGFLPVRAFFVASFSLSLISRLLARWR